MYIPKIQPVLQRKRQLIRPANVKVVVDRSKLLPVHQVKKSEPPVARAQSVPVCRLPRVGKRVQKVVKPATVKYITQPVSADSQTKIKQLKGVGHGKVLIIVGNGPSINEIDLPGIRELPGIDFMSINKPDERIWPTQYWVFFDLSQLRRHQSLWDNFKGIIINSTSIKQSKLNSLQVRNIGGKGFSLDALNGIHIGRSSVYGAMQLAHWMEYSHIYIIGCDMNPNGVGGKLHFYGTNPDVKPDARANRFQKEAEFYDHAGSILDSSIREKFTFCSSYNSWPFVKHFNSLNHLHLYEHLKALDICSVKSAECNRS